MSSEQLLDQTCKSASFPEMARLLLPSTLGDEIKKAVLKLSSEEFVLILNADLEKVERGSVETVNVLVRKSLQD